MGLYLMLYTRSHDRCIVLSFYRGLGVGRSFGASTASPVESPVDVANAAV